VGSTLKEALIQGVDAFNRRHVRKGMSQNVSDPADDHRKDKEDGTDDL
jgi:hypothetical protein